MSNAKSAPIERELLDFSVVLADTEYHSCNRIVNKYFQCGRKKFTEIKGGMNAHYYFSKNYVRLTGQ